MKKLKTLLTFALIFVMSFAFAACTPKSSDPSAKLIGVWKSAPFDQYNTSNEVFLELKDDNTCKVGYKHNGYTESIEGAWYFKDDVLILIFDVMSSAKSLSLEYSEGKLLLSIPEFDSDIILNKHSSTVTEKAGTLWESNPTNYEGENVVISLKLNDDGTCELTEKVAGMSAIVEGTWFLKDDILTLILDAEGKNTTIKLVHANDKLFLSDSYVNMNVILNKKT